MWRRGLKQRWLGAEVWSEVEAKSEMEAWWGRGLLVWVEAWWVET